MAVKQLAHVCIHSSNIEKSIAFYSDTLGLPVKFRFIKEDGSVFGAYFDAGNNTFIEVFKSDQDKPSEARLVHLCLEVDSIKDTLTSLETKGVKASEPKMGSDQSLQAWITDPDGVRIELHEYTVSSSQLTCADILMKPPAR